MKKYEILLKNEKAKTYRIIGWLVTAINFSSFIVLIFTVEELRQIKWFITGAALVAIACLVILLNKKKRTKLLTGHGFIFVISALTWLKTGYIIPGVANLLLYFFEKLNKRSLLIRVFTEKLIYPSFPEKTFKWDELNNVILKDDLITIDLKNNKLIQAPVDELSPEIDENEFNEFCLQQLAKSGPTD